MNTNEKLQKWESPTLAEIRVSAEVTAYIATK
ncbi:pyrroloquinoline quinone precursor peptide PqqA [Arthrobacter sp. cf158]|nr:pyrroloquinoline quinone precursor peptide PqqA [Arthrobacter sp. cf158]